MEVVVVDFLDLGSHLGRNVGESRLIFEVGVQIRLLQRVVDGVSVTLCYGMSLFKIIYSAAAVMVDVECRGERAMKIVTKK